MIALLLSLQAQGPDSTYSSPALRDLITRAVEANASPPSNLQAYAAKFESEVAIIKREPNRVEGSSTIEQIGGVFRWDRAKGFEQHREGYRVVTTGVPLPGSTILSNGWVLPNLSGTAYRFLGAGSGVPVGAAAAIDSAGPRLAHSPLAADRETYYRFEAGDTVSLDFPNGPPERLIRVIVWPREDQPDKVRIFRGDLYLDPATMVLRRIRGQFLTIGGPPPSGKSKRLNSLFLNAIVVDIINTQVPGAGWIPTYQWMEIEVLLPFSIEMWSNIRVMTTLRDLQVDTVTAPGSVSPLAPTETGLTLAPKDSLASYKEWQAPADKAPLSVYASELFDVGPPQIRPVGPPVFFIRAPTTLNILQFNRADGLYIAAPATLRLRSALPGLSVFGFGGYAFWSGRPRFGVNATLERGGWFVNADGQRILDITTKFSDPLDYGRGLRALFQADNYNYVDRTTAGGGIGRYFSAFGPGSIQARVDWVKDRTTTAELNSGPFGQKYYANPAVDPYDYPRARISVAWHPAISSRFVKEGVGASALLEAGGGSLPYQQIQGGFVFRKNWRLFVLTVVGNAGVTFADNPPTQQLFVIGGSGSLPGYTFNQFAGDQGVLIRGLFGYVLPFLRSPIRVGAKTTIPPIAPNLSFRIYTGLADVSDSAATASVNRLGIGAVPTDGFKSSIEIRLSLFGTLFGFGFAKALESNTDWVFNFTLAQSF